ncbi:hypothetical protein JCM10212_005732 [Sporobolomyces blumeae]
MSTTSNAGPPPSKANDGFWASLSPEDQKKYTLVFLVSLGTTLLVTGRSGGSLLKRAKNSEASAPGPAVSHTPQVESSRRRAPPPPPRAPAVAPLASTKRTRSVRHRTSDAPPLPEAPPASFLHPDLLHPPSSPRRRLLPSFVSTPRPASVAERPSPSAYFLPNSTLTSHSTAYASELDRADKLHEEGDKPGPTEAELDELRKEGFNPAVFAMKALGIATALTFSAFGVGVYGVMRWFGVSDLEGLSLALTHQVSPTLDEHRPSLPSWALPSTWSSTRSTEGSQSRTASGRLDEDEDATEREELSYWAQVKETLDREAEEKKRDRRAAWERMRAQAGVQDDRKTADELTLPLIVLVVRLRQARQVPPFTRSTLGLIALVTVPTLLHVVSPYSYAFIPHRVSANWELHRLVLPFFLGGGGIPVIFNTIMVYRSLKDLEVNHFRERLSDMTWAFILMCGAIIGLNTPLMTPILFNPFLMAIVHLWGQTNQSGSVSLYGLVTVPAPYFSLALLGMDLLQGGPAAVVVSLTGMIAAHAYYYLSVVYPRNYPSSHLASNLFAPPQFLLNLLGNGPSVPSSFAPAGAGAGSTSSASSRGFGTAYRPTGQALGGGGQRLGGGGGAAGVTTGASTGTAARGGGGERQASHRWGRGNRLGSE